MTVDAGWMGMDWAQLTADVLWAPVWFALGVALGWIARGRRAWG